MTSVPDVMVMDPLFMASRLFRRRKFEECGKLCTEVLEKNPYDQVGLCGNQDNPKPHLLYLNKAAWFLKIRSITEQTYVDEVEMDEEGIAELFMDDNVLADVAST